MQVGNQEMQMCFIRLFSLRFFSPRNKRSVFVILNPKLAASPLVLPPNSDSVIPKAAENHMSYFVRVHYCCTHCPLFLHKASFVDYKLFINIKSKELLKSVTVREEHESTEEANEDEPIKIKKRK